MGLLLMSGSLLSSIDDFADVNQLHDLNSLLEEIWISITLNHSEAQPNRHIWVRANLIFLGLKH